jgi:putative exporter of polyketide antibiotics
VVLSVAPRVASATIYAVIVGSLVIDLFGSLVASLHWLRYVSLFHYMALAPAQAASPLTLAVSTALGVFLGAVATAMFRRRDLQSA